MKKMNRTVDFIETFYLFDNQSQEKPLLNL